MKTFQRHRTPDEIRKACEEAGFRYDQEQFDKGGDCISFDFEHGEITAGVCYSTVNGRAFGEYWRCQNGKRSWFTTDSADFDRRPWFKALLAFIYVS